MNEPFFKKQVTCPHCGHKNEIALPQKISKGLKEIYCDIEKGGCDKPFVLIYRVSFDADIAVSVLDWIPEPKEK